MATAVTSSMSRAKRLPGPRQRHRRLLSRPRASGPSPRRSLSRSKRNSSTSSQPVFLRETARAGWPAETRQSASARARVFFSNSGAEANEGLFKLARKVLGTMKDGFEILTATNSLSRTDRWPAIAATGQDKVKKRVLSLMNARPSRPHPVQRSPGGRAPGHLARHRRHHDRRRAGRRRRGRRRPPEYLLGPARVVRRGKKTAPAQWTAVAMAAITGRGRFQSFQKKPSKVFQAVRNFCPMAFPWAKSLGGGFSHRRVLGPAPYADLLRRGAHMAQLTAALPLALPPSL